MAHSYRFCKVKKFEKTEGYYKPVQLTIEGLEEEAECKFTKTSESIFFQKEEIVSTENPNEQIYDNLTLLTYNGYLDLVVKKRGKVFQKEFTKYLEPKFFQMYFVKGLELFIFGASKEVVDEFIHQINSDPKSGLQLEPIEVDFSLMRSFISIITGVWFGDMNKQYLKTAGYFGSNVDRSKEFQEALDNDAKISQLLFDYSFQGDKYTIGITKDGAVILYANIKDSKTKRTDLRSEIQLALQVYLKFIAKPLSFKSV